MKRVWSIAFLLGLLLHITTQAQEREVKLKIVQTSDIHGNYYPYDFIQQNEAEGSLARVCSYVQEERKNYGDRLILVDNGDILQGQPSAYYFNYIDTTSTHLCAEMLNYMDYDAGNMGNHDVETGRKVFDRWASDCHFPVLGANIVETDTEKPHFKPYIILEREGVKIAILGMITPAIPAWLSENLWEGLRFDDMEDTARRWMKVIREQEKPDLVIGLFHSGKSPYLLNGKYHENASADVARRVEGFDVVLMGHDHALACEKVANTAGDSVWIVNPANNARIVSEVEIALTLKNGHVNEKQIACRLVPMEKYGADPAFMQRFASQEKTVHDFISRKIGTINQTISTRHLHPFRLFWSFSFRGPHPPAAIGNKRSRHITGCPLILRCRNQGGRHLRERHVQPLQVRKHALHHATIRTRDTEGPRNVLYFMDKPHGLGRG